MAAPQMPGQTGSAPRGGGESNSFLPYVFIAPAVLLILVFLVYPIGNVFYYSLQHYNWSKPYYNGFAGMDNFVDIFTNDPLFYRSLLTSLQWVVSQVGLQLVIGLVFALLLNQNFRLRGMFRSLAFIPWAISGVMTSVVWSLIYNEHMGVLNDLLLRLGLIDAPVAWTANVGTAFASVVIGELWRGVPFFAITLLAALQTIPHELYESARVDGAGRLKTFAFVVLPFLKNTIILTTLLRTAWEFNNVDFIFNLTGGGPAHETTTLTMYVAELAVKGGNFGYGSALTVVSFAVLLVFSIAYLRISRFGKEA